jgi:Fe-S cluster assembly protein SufD
VLDSQPVEIDGDAIRQLPFQSFSECKLVFVDGQFSESLSSRPRQDGIVVKPIRQALVENEDVIKKYLGQISQDEDNAFIALNTAYFQDGLFVHAGKNQSAKNVIQLIFVHTGKQDGNSIQPRNLIVAEEGSALTVLESYIGRDEEIYFTNAVSEFSIGDNARVEHIKFQDESKKAYHIAAIQAELGRDSYFASHSIALGAQLSRNNIRTLLNGEGLNCLLNGLYIATGNRLADHHMIVDHAKPHGESHEYFNGILDDQGRGVFHGRIYVREDAQKTDAKQTNKSLLLSDEAITNTKPQLEIYADDVKCTHGATIGQLNEEAIFYLRAHGCRAPAALHPPV